MTVGSIIYYGTVLNRCTLKTNPNSKPIMLEYQLYMSAHTHTHTHTLRAN